MKNRIKTIVVSGAHSKVGKTSLARELCALIPGSVHIKIGHGIAKKDSENVYYHIGTSFDRIASENSDADFLVIESNRILEEISPDCSIYLPGKDPKRSAALAAESADIIRGQAVRRGTFERLCRSLGLSGQTVHRIISLSGAGPCK